MERPVDLSSLPFHVMIAYSMLEKEMEKIRLQFSRIAEDRARVNDGIARIKSLVSNQSRIPKEIPQEMTKFNGRTFADIHYLLVSLAMCDKLFTMIEKEMPHEHGLTTVRNKYKQALKDYSDFRADIEHVYDRIRRGESDLGNLSNDSFTFNGRMFSIGADRQREIEEIFLELTNALGVIADKTSQAQSENSRHST